MKNFRKTIAATAVAVASTFLLAGCFSHNTPAAANVNKNLSAQQNAATGTLHVAQPVYYPKHSDELDNINERTARFEDPHKLSYITVMTLQGGVLYHGIVRGKVSSVDSQNTPADGLDCQHFGANDPRPDGCGVIQIAQPDGSWGTNNPNAVFWFDDKNVYHETPFPYFMSDQEQILATPPVLNINAQQQSNALAATASGVTKK